MKHIMVAVVLGWGVLMAGEAWPRHHDTQMLCWTTLPGATSYRLYFVSELALAWPDGKETEAVIPARIAHPSERCGAGSVGISLKFLGVSDGLRFTRALGVVAGGVERNVDDAKLNVIPIDPQDRMRHRGRP